MPRSFWPGVLVLATVAVPGVRAVAGQIRDVDGRTQNLFQPAGRANVLVFVSSDCPVSNGYAPEIQRICDGARSQGMACSLVYEDMSIDAAAVRAHREQYRYQNIAAVIDRDRELAGRAKATVTPEAVIVGTSGVVKYRGRIDNQYIALGKARQVVSSHDLRDAIAAVANGRPVAHPETQAFGCFIPQRGYQP